MNRNAGFTLLEALVAMAMLAFAILMLLGSRTEALIDATMARNWRLAKEIANEKMSELKAGARELPPEPGTRSKIEDHPDFEFQIIVGETRINDFESRAADDLDAENGSELTDRLDWRRERDQWRRAQQKGVDVDSYREQIQQEEFEDEDKTPSETDFEDVMVVVYFPDVRNNRKEGDRATYSIKEKVSTLAIEGLTPEQAEALAASRGDEFDKNAGKLPVSSGGSQTNSGGQSAAGRSGMSAGGERSR